MAQVALPTQPSPSRRHSAPHISPHASILRRNQGDSAITSSVGHGSHDKRTKNRNAVLLERTDSGTHELLSTIHEDGVNHVHEDTEADLEHSVSHPASSSNARWSKRLSWIPGWNIAGEGGGTRPTEDDDDHDGPHSNQERHGSLARIRNSVSIIDAVIRDTQPSHESNFPPNPEFPVANGQQICLTIYGTIRVDEKGYRLQCPRGCLEADFEESAKLWKEYKPLLDFVVPLLRDGDMLVKPFLERFTRDPHLAMIVRGAIQDFTFKCYVVGLFPMKVFEDWNPRELEPYQLDAMVYEQISNGQ